MKRFACVCLLLFLPLFLGAKCRGGTQGPWTYWVATTGNDANDGALARPFRTFARAAQAAQPGDTVFIRGGSYTEAIHSNSGSADKRIYWSAFLDEQVVISGVYACIVLTDRSYVTIGDPNGVGRIICDGGQPGPTSTLSRGVGMARGSYNVIQNSTFRNIGQAAIDIFQGSHHNVVRGNLIHHIGNEVLASGDGIWLSQGAHANLFEDNSISFGGHNDIYLIDAYDNIVRDNDLTNEWWRAVGINGPTATRNVIDGNRIYGVRVSPNSNVPPFNPPALQVQSPQNIIRRNLIWDNIETGITLQPTSGGSVASNRIYQNTLWLNQQSGILIDDNGTGLPANSNVIANNIITESGFSPYLEQLFGNGDTTAEQVKIDVASQNLANNFFFSNVLRDDRSDDTVILVIGPNPPFRSSTVSYYQTNFPLNFVGNLDVDPGFVDENAANFALAASSPARDSGEFLTETLSGGTGTTLPLLDATFFSDGFGVTAGDLVQLEGQGQPAQICAVNYGLNTISVDRTLSWAAGQGVALAYVGSAPDRGALEFGAAAPPALEPCTAPGGGGGGGACGCGFELAFLLPAWWGLRRLRTRPAA